MNKWIIHCFKNYTNFRGRASRSEYWYFLLSLVIILMAWTTIGTALDGILSDYWDIYMSEEVFFIPFLLIILFYFLPILAVSVRRLHDVGQPGWWVLISFVPYVGLIVLLIFYTQKGEIGTNKWGKNPEEVESDDLIDHLINE